jgi:hypothetical protein
MVDDVVTKQCTSLLEDSYNFPDIIVQFIYLNAVRCFKVRPPSRSPKQTVSHEKRDSELPTSHGIPNRLERILTMVYAVQNY